VAVDGAAVGGFATLNKLSAVKKLAKQRVASAESVR
jgi:hypothetical protein